MKNFVLISVTFFLFISFNSNGQAADSLSKTNDSIAKARAGKKNIYSKPRRASVLSAILPGAGQVYNRKYWKVPIIYAGIGGFGYMFYYNNNEYHSYRNALLALVKDPTLETVGGYNLEQLQKQKVYYEKYRNFASIGLGIIYILNIVDANVDAHLKSFDVSDDLSISISTMQQALCKESRIGFVTGISLKLNFK